MTDDAFTPLSEFLTVSQKEWSAEQEHDSEVAGHPAKDRASILPEEERYQILGTIHEGRKSKIYQARDNLLGRVIALKQLDNDYSNRETYLRQMRECILLEHPNILRIYDIHERKGQIAMEYVLGRDLRSTLHLKGALAHDMAVYIAIQLVNGLHQAHSSDIIHHALTPEHILLTRQSTVKIVAFRAPDSFMRFQEIENLYNALYIPPEIFHRRQLTVASNIFSFGVILYEMFAGVPPFPPEVIKTWHQHGGVFDYDETPLPGGLSPVIRRCLAKARDQRYTTIRTVGELMIRWYEQSKPAKTHDENMEAYRDFLLMAWADGKLTEEEMAFLGYKRKELEISESEARQAEIEIKKELQQMLH